jgi:hypothetical protein
MCTPFFLKTNQILSLFQMPAAPSSGGKIPQESTKKHSLPRGSAASYALQLGYLPGENWRWQGDCRRRPCQYVPLFENIILILL